MTSRLLYKFVGLKDLYPPSVANAEYIREEALKYVPKVYNIEVDPIIMMESNIAFLEFVFGRDFTQEYLKFLDRAKWVENEKSQIFSTPTGRKHNRVSRVEIPHITTVNDATTQLHEFLHYLRYTKNPKMCRNFLYGELPSILIQLLYGYFCDMNFEFSKDISAMLCEIDYRIAVDLKRKESFKDLSYDYYVGENPTPEMIKSHERYILETLPLCKYFFSSVYALRLLTLYQEDENHLRRKFKAIGTGGLSIDQLLVEYNINLCDEATVENTVGYMRVRSRQEIK